MKTILQTQSGECGLACLAMISDHFGRYDDLTTLRQKFPISINGATLGQLMRHAAGMNLSGRPVSIELKEITSLRLPCVIHWNFNHFLVLYKIKKSRGEVKIYVVDPAVGKRVIHKKEFSESFTGVVLELVPNDEFEKNEKQNSIRIKDIVGHIYGLRSALIQVTLMSIVLEILTLATPMFNQFIVDDVIVSGDYDLLTVLLFTFALVLITQSLIAMARSWFLMRWTMDIGLQWARNIFFHLIRLPIGYFQARHIGDIVSRFGSAGAIQSVLTGLLVESTLDGLMALLAIILMLMYSVKLTIIIVISAALYLALRIFFYGPLKNASQEKILLSAKESSNFLETIRAITPLKLFSKEIERTAAWSNIKQDVNNRDIKTQKINMIFGFANTMIFGIQGMFVFYYGAHFVMDGSLSIGMLVAFNSYSSTFSGRIAKLIDSFSSYKMLGIHIERLSDIILEVPDEITSAPKIFSDVPLILDLEGIKFRYAAGEPWILDGINLHIRAGETIAIIGPSGTGKSSLCKIILGLLAPIEGQVKINNLPISRIGNNAYRELLGTVMQEDILLKGSVFDNICFFEVDISREQVYSAAKAASIHDEILSMPMGYFTLVGDMGSSLSGGQKQRLLLARALFKMPKILVLDEATSHLDQVNEKNVNDSIKKLNITRILVAHRKETIELADRVYSLSNGKLTELPDYNFQVTQKYSIAE